MNTSKINPGDNGHMLRLGQIGVGIWGSNLLRNFAAVRNARVVACCDKDKGKLRDVQGLYPGMATTTRVQDLFEKHELDAIIIATPPSTHGKLAELSLKNRKHVFVEKPIALKMKDALRILRMAESSGLVLMVGHLLLYHPAVRLLKRIIDQGELGKVLYMYSTRVNLGQVRLEENAMWSLAPHDVSVAMYLLGQTPTEVMARGEAYLQKGIEDVIFMSLKFGKRRFSNIHVSWLDPHKIRKFTIVGSRKMAVFDDMEPVDKVKIYDKGVERTGEYNYQSFFTLRHGDVHIPKVKLREPLKLECQHFVDSVSGRRRPFTDGRNGVEVLSVLDAAERSLKLSGRAVKVRKVGR
ncbi:MAG: Gfo/Idh/MocA family oxidoreductase [Candidatus Omnitrophota bacterium]